MEKQVRKLRLSKVRIKNFINFEYVELDFNNENMFQFVGCNGSGKTSMLEAIRRCTESKSNHSFSTIPKKDEMSFVLCTFKGNIVQRGPGTSQGNNEQAQDITQESTSTLPQMRKPDSEKLVSIYISWHDNCTIRKVIKAIFFTQNDDISTEMVWTIQTESEEIRWIPYHKTLEKDVLETILQDNCDLKFIQEKIVDDNKLMKPYEITNGGVNFDNKFCDLVKIEFFYPFRGISKIQSSEQMPHVTSEDHFRSGTERSYIITRYLENEDEYDVALEQDIFKRLTPDDDFSFHFTKDKSAKLLEVRDNRASSTISVLKTPVGVLEAKYLSITLAKKKSGIVIIEEPGRGMHPDMIRRMVYLVFQDKKIMSGKMVIITTHDKNFLTQFTIKNTFLCKKTNGRIRQVKPLACVETGSRNRRQSSIELGSQKESSVEEEKFHKRESVECRFLAAVVFSQRIMFLEGESDFTLIETIKQLLITKKHLREEYLKALEYEYNPDIQNKAEREIIQFLASLNVEMMNGVKNMRRINDMCYYLGLQENRFFLVDYDVLGTIDKALSLDFSNLEWFNLQILEGNGVFVWDNDTVDSSINHNQTEDKGVQCPGILRQDKVTGAGVPPKPGSLEDVIIQFSLQHDKLYHFGSGTCNISNCIGLAKLLKEKKIADIKNWPSLFIIDKSIFEICVRGEIEVDETSSQVFSELISQGEERQQNAPVEKQNIKGQIKIKAEGKIKTCEIGNVYIFQRPTSELEESSISLQTTCNGTAFTFSPDNYENKIECKDNSTINININKILKSQTKKKGITIYNGHFDISVEREMNDGGIQRKCIKCTERGSITIEEKPQWHRKLCMTEKFLLQNTLTHADILEVVETFLKCSMEYRSGQLWRFLRFLADKALNRRTEVSISRKGDRFIQRVQIKD